MNKRSIIIAVIAVICFAGALFSIVLEKTAVEKELNNLLNGKEPDTDTGTDTDTDTDTDNTEPGEETE